MGFLLKIYVGNISKKSSEGDVRSLFEEYGTVSSCVIIKDRFSGESKGFGFVEMEDDEEAKAAMQALNSYLFQGRPLTVNEARPREERPAGGGRNFNRTDRPREGFGGGPRSGNRDRFEDRGRRSSYNA